MGCRVALISALRTGFLLFVVVGLAGFAYVLLT
jgi:hypothetical protein